MEFDRFLNLVAASLGALGSIYVLKSYLRMTPAAAADLATPRWGFSIPILESLSAQRAEAIIGAVFFFSAFVVGTVGIAFVPSTPLFGSRGGGVLADLCITAAGIAVAGVCSRTIRRRYERAGRLALLREAYDEVASGGHSEQEYVDAVAQAADALFGTTLNGNVASVVLPAAAKILGIPEPHTTQKLSSPTAS